MKKLMIAAAVAAMTAGAIAECVDPSEPDPVNCAAVYDVRVTLKTLAAKQTTTTTKVECDDPIVQNSCYLVAASRKYSGIIASCECICDHETYLENAKTYFWCTSTKTPYCDATIIMGNVIRYNSAVASRAKKAGATIAIGGADSGIALAGAGFGSYSPSLGNVSKISGNIAGVVEAPVCTIKCSDPTPAYGFNVCDDTAINPEIVPAYGTWSIKYNSSASKKYMNNSTYVETKLLPSYYTKNCINE